MALSLSACGGSDDVAVVTPVTPVNQALSLTVGVDAATAGAGDDTITGDSAATTEAGATVNNNTFTALDAIDGGAGSDTLNITQVAAFTIPAGVSVVNVETANITSSLTVTANTSTWTGLTELNTTGVGAQTITAAAGTDVSVTASTHAAAAVAVNGGDDVSVTTTGATTGTVTVGATTAAAGSVTVNVTQAAMADGAGATTQVGGLITVTGGDSITVVNTVAGSTGGSNHAGDIVTASAVTATGDASTTSVSVTQTAEAARVADATGVTGSAAIANGVVTIADAVGVATALDTISTVTLNNYANSTVASSALTTVNVTGGSTAALASGTLGLNTQSTAAGGATTLNINGSGFIGAIDGTQADDYTTVNIAASSDFTIADVNFALATAVNASGAGVTTITALTDVGAVTAFTSTGGGLELGAAIGTAVTFTGGAGADSVILGATTKDIDMGAGDDTVTINAVPGAGGSIAGGAGDDTIVANTNTSSISASAAIGGFETLRVAGTAAQGAHNATGFAAIELGVTAAAASSFTNVAAGVDMTILGSLAGAHSVVLADATGTADSMDITLSSAGALDAQTADLTVAGVETFTITTVDTNTTAHTNLLDLVAAAATSVTVTGNAGLDMGTSVAALVTNFDASGVSGAAADAAAMAVTYTSDNVTVGENVTIIGGSGNDVLTGGAVTHDTIEGGAGVDTIVYTGGNDVFTGGAGNDIFDVNALGTATVHLTISDLAVGDTIDIAGIDAGTATWNATELELGAGATLAQYLDAAAAATTGATNSVARWFQFDGDTYITNDNTDDATFAATDAVIEITGLVDLSDATLTTTVLTIA